MDGSQKSYSAGARQGSKFCDRTQSLAGEKLCVRAEKMLPFPWKWNPSVGLGGNGWEGHLGTAANSLENTIASSACNNETAALAITNVSHFMAVISFLIQRPKNALLWQEKSEVSLAACY